jgi:hypothetical protein
MSSANVLYLVPHPDGKAAFNIRKLMRSIRFLDGVGNWIQGQDERLSLLTEILFECEVTRGGLTFSVTALKDKRCVTVEPLREITLEIALEIHRHYGEEIWATTEISVPDFIALSSASTFAELARRLRLTFLGGDGVPDD